MTGSAEMLLVDVAALTGLEHECVGCADPAACCCARFEVCAGAEELAAIEGLLPRASRYCPHLKGPHGYENVFDPIETGLYCIDTDEEGLCLFAYAGKSGVRCSLHSAALALGVAPAEVKPAACVLWPLAITDPPGRVLGVHEDAMAFDCNKARRRGLGALCPGVAEIVDGVFGHETRMEIEQAAARGLRRVRVLMRGRLAGGK